MPWSGATERGAALVAAACLAAAASSCARPSQPPGAPDESDPPAIRSLRPALDSVVPEMSGRATIEFDEPIRAGSDLGRQLVASPAYRFSASAGHSEISVRPEGGWRPGAVYVLRFPSGITDLLNNARDEPVRMVFSTGPPIRPTLLRARLFDRVTGEEQADGRVLYLAAREDGEGGGPWSPGDTAASAGDTVPYTAVADTGSVYVLRHVPPGRYWAFGFVDRNQDRRLDRSLEPYDSARVTLGSDSAEASVALFTLEPDSTPPRLGRVETPDSVTIRLGFDDHLRPGQAPGSVRVLREDTGDSLPVVEARALTAADTAPPDTVSDEAAAGEAPAPDSASRDTTARGPAAADSAAGGEPTAPDSAGLGSDAAVGADPAGAAAADDTAPAPGPGGAASAGEGEAGQGPRGEAEAEAGAPGETDARAAQGVDPPPRPTRTLRLRLGAPMPEDTLRVSVAGVSNMWGLTVDADTAFVFTPPADTLPADSAGEPAAPDSAGLGSDAAVDADPDPAADTVSTGVDSVVSDTARRPAGPGGT